MSKRPEVHGQRRRRWKRGILIAVGVLALLVALTPVANAVWCAQRLPETFASSMRGTFDSDQYWFVSGRLFIDADFSSMVCGETREAEVLIYYNLWSPYRPGQTVRARIAFTAYDGALDGSNTSVPARYPKAEAFLHRERYPNEPLLTFRSISDRSVVGVYRVARPQDSGHFTIQAE